MYITVLKQIAEGLISDIFSREEKERILEIILECDVLADHDDGSEVDRRCTMKQYPIPVDEITPAMEYVLSRPTVINDVYIKVFEFCGHTSYEIRWGEQAVFKADKTSTELTVSLYRTSPMGWEKHLKLLAGTEPAMLEYNNNFCVANAGKC